MAFADRGDDADPAPPPGIHVHRSRHADATTHYGIRVTTPARTLVDLADVLTPPTTHPGRQRGPGPTARHRGRADHPPHRYPGRRTSPLTPERGTTPTRSHLEDSFTRFLNHHDLPLPERNQRIAGHEVDAVYRAQKLVLELDSRKFHTTPNAFEQDRDRDADLLDQGFQPSASPTTASSTTPPERPKG
jgi:hypothetical protein